MIPSIHEEPHKTLFLEKIDPLRNTLALDQTDPLYPMQKELISQIIQVAEGSFKSGQATTRETAELAIYSGINYPTYWSRLDISSTILQAFPISIEQKHRLQNCPKNHDIFCYTVSVTLVEYFFPKSES